MSYQGLEDLAFDKIAGDPYLNYGLLSGIR